jgi:prolipoprotein diacylglyceryltransferase
MVAPVTVQRWTWSLNPSQMAHWYAMMTLTRIIMTVTVTVTRMIARATQTLSQGLGTAAAPGDSASELQLDSAPP